MRDIVCHWIRFGSGNVHIVMLCSGLFWLCCRFDIFIHILGYLTLIQMHFPDDILRCIFLNENVMIWINFSSEFIVNGLIDNIPSLVVQIMAWRTPGDKPLSEPLMIILLTHICVTRPQWVKYGTPHGYGVLFVVFIFSAPRCSGDIQNKYATLAA